MSILLSVGHNSESPGACHKSGICEYHLAKRWINKIFYNLIASIHVDFVRGTSLQEKVNYINNDPDVKLAIELHFNANIQNAHGSETLYYPGSKSGKELAILVQDHFQKNNIFQPNRGAKEGWYKMNPENGPDYFLKKTKCTSIIIEPDFISNLDLLNENEHQGCQAISNALHEYYIQHFGYEGD